jgi:internalin A
MEKRVRIEESGKGSRLSDFSPLTGMGLTALQCPLNAVRDLSPLRGMALRSFISNGCTQIADLSPLAGMPLEALSCQHSQVRDLSPLEKCKDLRILSLVGVKVTPRLRRRPAKSPA